MTPRYVRVSYNWIVWPIVVLNSCSPSGPTVSSCKSGTLIIPQTACRDAKKASVARIRDSCASYERVAVRRLIAARPGRCTRRRSREFCSSFRRKKSTSRMVAAMREILTRTRRTVSDCGKTAVSRSVRGKYKHMRTNWRVKTDKCFEIQQKRF